MDVQDLAAPAAERPPAPADPDRRPVAPPEPATPRALWPTFMRRTLDEDLLRAEAPRPRPRP